ncbi:MAG TPA: permease-like cell division protein FtsX [Gaiellaceae bacterium]|nr:permease-like cell division protein FtsX [Gaiellaceae bacterium]
MRLRLVVAEAWRSLRGNLSTTVAATVTVLIGMFLLGLFIALGTWVVSWSNHVKRELLVKVYFDDTAGVKQWNDAAKSILGDSRVKDVEFVSKEKALVIMRKKYPELTNDLAYNPLPNSIEVTPKKAEQTLALSSAIRGMKLAGVDKVKDGKNTAHRILSVAKVIESIFLIAVVVLLAASTLLIANTIRLSIFSRRREIEVMKLVGATNWFVRGPFMLEGLLCGLAGAIAAVILLLLGKEVALPAILAHTTSSSDVHALAFPLTALILVAAGLLLGAAGSGLTIRRFLRV